MSVNTGDLNAAITQLNQSFNTQMQALTNKLDTMTSKVNHLQHQTDSLRSHINTPPPPSHNHDTADSKDNDDHTCGHKTGHYHGFGHSEPGSDLGNARRQVITRRTPDHTVIEPTFESKLQTLITDGPHKLLCIFDFDRTITPLRNKSGDMCLSSHGIIENSNVLPEVYRKNARLLFEHYYPIEFDPKIPDDEKQTYLVEWWSRSHRLLIDYGVTKQLIEECVADAIKTGRALLRDGATELFALLAKYNIRVIVFSAGLYDVIHELFKQLNLLTPNVTIASNQMQFDETGKLVSFKGQLIHSLNKQYSAIECQINDDEHNHATHDTVDKASQLNRQASEDHAVPRSDVRTTTNGTADEHVNVLLFGDNVADVKMEQGLKNVDTTLKFGFVNDRVDERISQYAPLFDALILDDGTFDFPTQVIKQIVTKKDSK